MNKEEIKDYLKRVDELELKLVDEDKDTLQWLIFGYNECARLLNETEKENQELKQDVKEWEYIFNTMHQRKLITKFDKEFSKEMVKKAKQEGNEIAGAYPDAEEVYKRYYDQKDRIDKVVEIIDLIKPELWNISNKMTYRLLDVKTTLKGDKE